MHLRFSFDLISPYARFAWADIRDLATRHGASLSLEPVLFAGLLNHWGHKGPAEIPAKRVFTVKQTARRAARMGVQLRWPAVHPFNPLTGLRVCLPEVSGDDQETAIDALFTAIWSEGLDGQDPETLAGALDRAELDGGALVRRTRDREVKQALLRNTEQAIARGLWGVPTVEADDELFWGHDSFTDLEAFLRGEDPIDAASYEAAARKLPSGATR